MSDIAKSVLLSEEEKKIYGETSADQVLLNIGMNMEDKISEIDQLLADMDSVLSNTISKDKVYNKKEVDDRVTSMMPKDKAYTKDEVNEIIKRLKEILNSDSMNIAQDIVDEAVKEFVTIIEFTATEQGLQEAIDKLSDTVAELQASAAKGDKGDQGEQGIPGTSLRTRGEWDPLTHYVNNGVFIDIVEYKGSSYLCIQSSINVAPDMDLDKEYWNLLTSKGDKGDQGEQGIQGPKGDVGPTGTSMRFRGEWSSCNLYYNNEQYVDVVTYRGSMFACIKTHGGHAPLLALDEQTDEWWQSISRKGEQGAEGPAGVGTVMNYKGTWDDKTRYISSKESVDIVFFNGSSYLCTESNTGAQPGAEGVTQWGLLAQKGDDGQGGGAGGIGYITNFTELKAAFAAGQTIIHIAPDIHIEILESINWNGPQDGLLLFDGHGCYFSSSNIDFGITMSCQVAKNFNCEDTPGFTGAVKISMNERGIFDALYPSGTRYTVAVSGTKCIISNVNSTVTKKFGLVVSGIDSLTINCKLNNYFFVSGIGLCISNCVIRAQVYTGSCIGLIYQSNAFWNGHFYFSDRSIGQFVNNNYIDGVIMDVYHLLGISDGVGMFTGPLDLKICNNCMTNVITNFFSDYHHTLVIDGNISATNSMQFRFMGGYPVPVFKYTAAELATLPELPEVNTMESDNYYSVCNNNGVNSNMYSSAYTITSFTNVSARHIQVCGNTSMMTYIMNSGDKELSNIGSITHNFNRQSQIIFQSSTSDGTRVPVKVNEYIEILNNDYWKKDDYVSSSDYSTDVIVPIFKFNNNHIDYEPSGNVLNGASGVIGGWQSGFQNSCRSGCYGPKSKYIFFMPDGTTDPDIAVTMIAQDLEDSTKSNVATSTIRQNNHEFSCDGCVCVENADGTEVNVYGAPCKGNKAVRFKYLITYTSWGADFTSQYYTIGVDLGTGDDKYCGAFMSNGMIFCVPSNASKVLMIDPVNNTSSLIGPDLGNGDHKWCGGCLSKDKRFIYCAPYNASQVLRIDTLSRSAALFGTNYGTDTGKATGAALSSYDGYVWLAPGERKSYIKFRESDGYGFVVPFEDNRPVVEGNYCYYFGINEGNDGRMYVSGHESNATDMTIVQETGKVFARVYEYYPEDIGKAYRCRGGIYNPLTSRIVGVPYFKGSTSAAVLWSDTKESGKKPYLTVQNCDVFECCGNHYRSAYAMDGIIVLPKNCKSIKMEDNFSRGRKNILFEKCKIVKGIRTYSELMAMTYNPGLEEIHLDPEAYIEVTNAHISDTRVTNNVKVIDGHGATFVSAIEGIGFELKADVVQNIKTEAWRPGMNVGCTILGPDAKSTTKPAGLWYYKGKYNAYADVVITAKRVKNCTFMSGDKYHFAVVFTPPDTTTGTSVTGCDFLNSNWNISGDNVTISDSFFSPVCNGYIYGKNSGIINSTLKSNHITVYEAPIFNNNQIDTVYMYSLGLPSGSGDSVTYKSGTELTIIGNKGINFNLAASYGSYDNFIIDNNEVKAAIYDLRATHIVHPDYGQVPDPGNFTFSNVNFRNNKCGVIPVYGLAVGNFPSDNSIILIVSASKRLDIKDNDGLTVKLCQYAGSYVNLKDRGFGNIDISRNSRILIIPYAQEATTTVINEYFLIAQNTELLLSITDRNAGIRVAFGRTIVKDNLIRVNTSRLRTEELHIVGAVSYGAPISAQSWFYAFGNIMMWDFEDKYRPTVIWSYPNIPDGVVNISEPDTKYI